jgi:citrate lyase beta subunit
MYVLDNGTRFVIPRTEMTYPGHNMKLHQTAADPVKAPVDHVMADFEDACPYEFKGPKSHKVMVEALNTLDFGRKVVTVRPNNIHSPFFKGDMEAVVLGAPNRFHGIMLPKTRGPEEIREVARLLDDLEQRSGWKYKIQIESLVETPQALVKAFEIATASDRMCGLVFGIADFAAIDGGRGQGCRIARNRQRLPEAVAQGGFAREGRRIAAWAPREERRRRQPRDGRHLGHPSAAGRNRQRLLHAKRRAGRRRAPRGDALP